MGALGSGQLPSFLYSAPKWLVDDLPGRGADSALYTLSNGDGTWGAQTIAAASIPNHGWLIYDNLTINGTVKWATPVLKILVLDTLTIDTGGQLNGGANAGGNASSGASGVGGASTLASGGAAQTGDGNGNSGSYNSGGSGARKLSGSGAGTGGGSTAFNRSWLPYKTTSDYIVYYNPSTGLYTSQSNYTAKVGANGGSATSTSTVVCGGGGGSSGMSLLIAANVCTVGGNGIVLDGGDGGDAYSGGADNANGGDGGNGGDLIVVATNSANGTRTVSGGSGGAAAGGGSAGSAGSAGTNNWVQLDT